MLKLSLRISLAICFALFLLTSATAQDKSNRLAASDAFNLEFAQDPQISPDGKKIIYVRQFADVMSDKYYTNLWIINFDGSDNRPLTTGHRSDSAPRWSPDGMRIAYI